MTIWCETQDAFMTLSRSALEQVRALVEPGLLARREIAGFCRGCGKATTFDVGPPVERETDWKDLREGLLCPCGFNGRMRMTVRILDELLSMRSFPRAAVLERKTPLYAHLERRLPGLIGCEYLGSSFAPGEMVDLGGIRARNENMMALSFGTGSLDLLMHFDILEHVPSADAGLVEAHRALADGGVMFFTCPFFHQLERNIVRARIDPNGRFERLLPDIYHGNPISSEGSLVFIHPSRELFDMLDRAGFRKVQVAVCYDPVEGIVSNSCQYPDGHMWPLAFVAWK